VTYGSAVGRSAVVHEGWGLPHVAQKLAEARTAAPHCSQNTVSFIVIFSCLSCRSRGDRGRGIPSCFEALYAVKARGMWLERPPQTGRRRIRFPLRASEVVSPLSARHGVPGHGSAMNRPLRAAHPGLGKPTGRTARNRRARSRPARARGGDPVTKGCFIVSQPGPARGRPPPPAASIRMMSGRPNEGVLFSIYLAVLVTRSGDLGGPLPTRRMPQSTLRLYSQRSCGRCPAWPSSQACDRRPSPHHPEQRLDALAELLSTRKSSQALRKSRRPSAIPACPVQLPGVGPTAMRNSISGCAHSAEL
jgi:hypothetical protein